MQLQQLIENHWYYKVNWVLSIVLLPLSGIFFLISTFRKMLYRSGVLKSYALPVPVIIIGNISVGGAGKTPLTKYLAQELTNSGVSVGIILRGYKSQVKTTKIVVAADSSQLVGDEALIYAQNNLRVAIGANRYLAGLTLLAQYPDIRLILADDGLQHYRLKRDYEIAVIDSDRMFGNHFVLPMGPLRETVNRLKSVNAIVVNGTMPSFIKNNFLSPQLTIGQTLILDKIYNPKTAIAITIAELITGNFAQKSTTSIKNRIIAMAAIGNPQRFFNFLTNSGIKLAQAISFPDHYSYAIGDLPQSEDIILVTEKDYTKLAAFNRENIWVVMVKPQLDNYALLDQIHKLL
ncbi:MAG: tetraacyldisaccharide 4'-kinase [Burkholderiales bacterium]|nr:tetraacyldisaccharide 4'-kinase [Burkholderiales bacterium]